MGVATTVEVGVRDLKHNLSKYLERVRGEEDVLVTDHGRPVPIVVAELLAIAVVPVAACVAVARTLGRRISWSRSHLRSAG